MRHCRLWSLFEKLFYSHTTYNHNFFFFDFPLLSFFESIQTCIDSQYIEIEQGIEIRGECCNFLLPCISGCCRLQRSAKVMSYVAFP
ncbi:hypothetical protein FGO68_gene1987 [Halteria grandinella]|uniref:Uncharacterized protein n=1 Tax=Halteria grandinella TaxID=5974 RepID=A0A8J8N9Z8_HALGN|nr:hypothetical protein FGO68_gene1987 [Halteria grandinella]